MNSVKICIEEIIIQKASKPHKHKNINLREEVCCKFAGNAEPTAVSHMEKGVT